MEAVDQFENSYQRLRKKEGRIYPDDMVAKLPVVPVTDLHYKEWKLRVQSLKSLKKYLVNKSGPLKILEVGSGNGWLSNQLATIPGAQVTGIDINSYEILQANRVFKKNNLEFLHTELSEISLGQCRFDIIVFAASIQYFPVISSILQRSMSFLKTDGEIHIMDSYFYTKQELKAAQQRSDEYFKKAGSEEMAAFYFHHCEEELENYKYRVLYKPSFFSRLKGKQNPFNWYCIRKSE